MEKRVFCSHHFSLTFCYLYSCLYSWVIYYIGLFVVEWQVCLSSFLWVKGAVKLVSCTTNLLIPEVGDCSFLCSLCSFRQLWVGAILTNHKINRLMFRDYSFMPSYHIPHIYSYAPTQNKLHVSVFTTLLTPGLRALFCWFLKVFFNRAVQNRYTVKSLSKSPVRRTWRDIEMIITMIVL